MRRAPHQRPSHILLLCLLLRPIASFAFSPDTLFQEGTDAYRSADYSRAAQAFRHSARLKPSSGALQNLGNAEWQRGSAGRAIIAWEQAAWLDPFNKSAQTNLRFVRKTSQLESPELAWYEVVSTWLPANWWAGLAGISFWVAIGACLLPGILRQRRATWHQAVAALGFTIFLLCLPAHLGVHTRSRIGFILDKDTPLRLTPTQESQILTRLSAGDPVRWQRTREKYVLLRTNHSQGWVEAEQYHLISQP